MHSVRPMISRSLLGLAVFAALLSAPPAALGASSAVSISVPAGITTDMPSAITLRLPNGVAAVEGRVLVDQAAAELVGVAPLGRGTSLAPSEAPDGFAFGVYGMKPRKTANDVRLVLLPHVPGKLEVRVIIDAAADKLGRRINLSTDTVVSRLNVDGSITLRPAPSGSAHSGPRHAASTVRALFGKPVISIDDLDIARAAWYNAHETGAGCASGGDVQGDANQDGCVDIVDLQALSAALGQRVTTGVNNAALDALNAFQAAHNARQPASQSASAASGSSTAVAALTGGLIFTVNSAADTADVLNGDGICADSSGKCTLRAALTESNWHAGANRIEFNLPGSAPVTIQLGSSVMSNVGSSGSSVTIDGYTQPGSHPNTAAFGTNAVPGVFIRGNGNSLSRYLLYVARPGNTIRGLLMSNAYRGVFLDTPNATGNQIVGNLIGFNADGSLAQKAHAGVYLNNGAHDNNVGTPALADRNVIGNSDKSVYFYGAGTDANVIQNNVLCIRPNGSTATCTTGIDVDFGPKSNLIGGHGANELNVIGPTQLNGVELSHGWDPSTNHQSTPEFQINYNQVVGNWVGFRVDGSYDSAYTSAQFPPSADNGQALHMHDGSNYNVFEGNYVAAAYDGVTIAMPNSTGDIVRGNIIGVSPLGQAAPLGRWGIYFTSNTNHHLVEGNIIRNAAAGGIGLIDYNDRQITLSQNIVTDTTGPAIYLAPDPSNSAAGANELRAAPQISAANPGSASGIGIAGATVEVFRASKNAGQVGLPIDYLGSAVVAADSTWSVAISAQTGQTVTATQTTTDGNTSGLSTNVNVGAAPPPPSADFSWLQRSNKLIVDFSDTSLGGPTSWSWDFGDGTTSNVQNPTKTFAAAGDYTVTLTAANGGGSTQQSHLVTVAPPSSGTVIAADSFTRVETASWDNADTGGLYALEGNSAAFSVANGIGSITLPKAGANRAAILSSTMAADVDVRVRVGANKAPAGGAYIAYVVARANGNNSYRPKLFLNANGTVSVHAGVVINGSESSLGTAVVVPGLVSSPGSFIWLRTEITGSNPTTVRVKAWADGQSEPAGWQFVATNSAAGVQVAGSVGLRGYLASSVSNGPVTISFDDLSAVAADVPPPSSDIASDTFERNRTGAWGTADLGGTYSLQGSAANFNVAAGVGTMIVPTSGLMRSALLDSVSAADLDIRFRVSIDKVATGGNYFVYAVSRRVGTSEYRPRIVFHSDGSITVNASRVLSGSESSMGSAVTISGLSQVPNSFIWVRAQVVGSNPTTINVKAWADGANEPSGWQFTATDASAALQSSGSIGLRAYLASGVSNAPLTLSFDDYSVVAPAP